MSFWEKTNRLMLCLAPMHGITSYLFRELQCRSSKPGGVYTEFVSAEGLAKVPEKFDNELRYSENQRPIIAQLFGVDPISYKKAITIIYKLGFDGVDINMGCPSSKIVRNGGGAALIGNINKVNRILTESVKATRNYNLPLSVKTRVVNDLKQNKEWFKMLSSYPLTTVAVHGRYINQNNHGPVNWERISESAVILRNKGIFVLGNGGIAGKDEGVKLCKKYQLDGCLIGQAAIGNPYVFKSDYRLNNGRRLEILKHIIRLIVKEEGNYRFIEIKHFIFHQLKGWPNSSGIKQQIICSSTVKDILKILYSYQKRVSEIF